MSVSWIRTVIPVWKLASSFRDFKYVVNDYDEEFDAATKSAVIKAAPSVVSLITHLGDKLVYIGSGTIIACDEQDEIFVGTILTSASLLRGSSGPALLPDNLEIDVYLSDGKLYQGKVAAYDFYHNIATVKIECTFPLCAATIRFVDDSTPIYSNKASNVLKSDGASSRFNLLPGERVISLARYFDAPYNIMASPGVLCAYECLGPYKEIFLTSCRVTKVVVGGPQVNYSGEVVGINFFANPFCAFVPINIAFKCLEDLKKGFFPRPWLGVDVANLSIANLEKLEMLNRKFPHVVKGVIIEQVVGIRNYTTRDTMETKLIWWRKEGIQSKKKIKVVGSADCTTRHMMMRKMIRKTKRGMQSKKRIKVKQESPASRGGLFPDDVIIRCCGQSIGSHLELTEALWDKEGKSIELVVVRPSVGKEMTLNLTVGTHPDDVSDRWCLPAESEGEIGSIPYHI